MFWCLRHGGLGAILLLGANTAAALTIIDTTPFADSFVARLRLDGAHTYQQTFKVPLEDSVLTSFSVFLRGTDGNGSGFRFEIADFISGSIGVPLASSHTKYEVDVGLLRLTPGATYTASLIALAPEGIEAKSSGSQNINPYPDGGFLFLTGDNQVNNHFFDTVDLAFVAVFVPEPSTALLLARWPSAEGCRVPTPEAYHPDWSALWLGPLQHLDPHPGPLLRLRHSA